MRTDEEAVLDLWCLDHGIDPGHGEQRERARATTAFHLHLASCYAREVVVDVNPRGRLRRLWSTLTGR